MTPRAATPLTDADRLRLHALARRRANALRREAFDAAWNALVTALRRPRRALPALEA